MKHRHPLLALMAIIAIALGLSGCGGPSAAQIAHQQKVAREKAAVAAFNQDMNFSDQLYSYDPVLFPESTPSQIREWGTIGRGFCHQMQQGVDPNDIINAASEMYSYNEMAYLLATAAVTFCPDQKMKLEYAFGG